MQQFEFNLFSDIVTLTRATLLTEVCNFYQPHNSPVD